MKYNEKIENIKEWEDTAAKQEFTYPMWFQNKSFGHVVKFEGLTVGEVVHGFENWFLDYTKSNDFPPHYQCNNLGAGRKSKFSNR